MDGLCASQPDVERKSEQQAHFPVELIERGLEFCHAAGYASVPDDRVRLLPEMSEGGEQLDAMVRGLLATATLRRALEADDDGTQRLGCLELLPHPHG